MFPILDTNLWLQSEQLKEQHQLVKCTISREISHRVFGGSECQPAGFPCVYVAVVASTDDDEKKSASASKKLPLLALT